MTRLGDGSHHELRVHGVAGTPPESMLDDLSLTSPAPDACGAPPEDAKLTVWQRRLDQPGLRAYSWSSVTSGSARSALYLLLLPHLLVNLAGWAALPTAEPGAAGLGKRRPVRGWPVRAVAVGVRLLALGLTVIMAQWALLIAVDLMGYQWAVRIREFPTWWLSIGVLGAALVVELVLMVTRLRLRPGVAASGAGAPLTDPVGYSWLTRDQTLLWSSPGSIDLQRRAHHGAALGSMGLVGVLMLKGWASMPEPWAAIGGWVSGVAVVAGVMAVVHHSVSTGKPGAAGWSWPATAARVLGRIGVLLVAVSAAGVDFVAASSASVVTPDMVSGLDNADLASMAAVGQPVYLPVVRGVGMALTIGYTAACLLVGLLAWQLRRQSGGQDAASRGPGSDGRGRDAEGQGRKVANLPGLALLGGAAGGFMGAATAAAVSRFLGGPEAVVVPGPLPEALAIAFSALAVVLGWILVVGLGIHLEQTTGHWRVKLTSAAQLLLRRGSWLMATLTVLGTAGVVMVALLVRSPDNPLHVLQGADPLPQLIVLATAGLVASAIGLAVLVISANRTAAIATAGVLLAAATVAVAQVSGDELTRQLRPAAMAIGLLTPAGFVLGKGLSALRSTGDRRTIAILWDVGTFFPRWFDPLSPPSYGDAVVTDLQALITQQLGRTVAGSRGSDNDDSHGDASHDDASHGDASHGEGPTGRTLLLAPHSQGTVIAAAAVLGLPQGVGEDRLALLSYGSPLRHLYAEFFPQLFDAEVLQALRDRLGGRWRNLARTSDPIGAPVDLVGVDVVMDHDPCGRGHSAYPREPEYADAVRELEQAMSVTLHIPEPSAATPPPRT